MQIKYPHTLIVSIYSTKEIYVSYCSHFIPEFRLSALTFLLKLHCANRSPKILLKCNLVAQGLSGTWVSKFLTSFKAGLSPCHSEWQGFCSFPMATEGYTGGPAPRWQVCPNYPLLCSQGVQVMPEAAWAWADLFQVESALSVYYSNTLCMCSIIKRV